MNMFGVFGKGSRYGCIAEGNGGRGVDGGGDGVMDGEADVMMDEGLI